MADNPQLAPQVEAELGRLLHELAHNKKGRRRVGELIRELKPDSPHAAAFADIEQEDKFEAFKREQEERELKKQQDETLVRMNAQRKALLEGGADGGRKYSEDDVKAIEALMEKKGITDYEDGATLYAATLPPLDYRPGAEPPAAHGATWEFPEFEVFAKNPAKAARDRAHQMIGEFMRKR